MTQFDFIKDIARYGLENDQERLLEVLNKLIEYSKNSKKVNFALHLQSILKEGLRLQKNKGMTVVGSPSYFLKEDEREFNDLILEKITSDYSFDNLVCDQETKDNLKFLVSEHTGIEILKKYDLPVSNKILFYGPSGCGKTLASYVLAGELHKMMYVINLGAIVSSKLGETSKNLAKLFRRAASEDCIIFLDEFDSIGKVRDYSQDHGEMKRVVNTILQLFDYLPQETIVIAATNQIKMIDDALLRRFDLRVNLELPNKTQIRKLINKTLNNSPFNIDKKSLTQVINLSVGLSYFIIQRSFISAIKRSLFNPDNALMNFNIDTSILIKLLLQEKKELR